jgi:nucleoside-diphosphate-sugar epimerase
MAKVLVTGGSGFIGYHLTEALVAQGHEVTCLVRPTSAVSRLERLKLPLQVYGGVDDREALRATIAGKSVVYHLAGLINAVRARALFRVNQEGTRNVAEACAQQDDPPVLIVTSSLAAAGPSAFDRPRTETEPLAAVSNYGRSKRGAEMAAQQFADRVPITVVRPPIVLGEADRVGLSLFRSVARTGVHLVSSRTPRRYSLIHAADLVRGMILAAERGRRLVPPHGDPAEVLAKGFYFLTGPVHPTYEELGRLVAQALGRTKVRIVRTGRLAVWTVACFGELIGRLRGKALYLNWDKAREIVAGNWTCSPAKAAEELGFSADTPLADRLRQTAEWYRQHGWL